MAKESEEVPTHDFAFFEWGFDSTQQSALAEEAATEEHSEEDDKQPLPPSKISIEDLMRPSIYKSLLSRELGGSTDLEWEAYRSVPRDVIELEDHRAVSSGHAEKNASKSRMQQLEHAESRLRQTAPLESLPRRATYPTPKGGSFRRSRTSSDSLGDRKSVHKLLSRLSLKRK